MEKIRVLFLAADPRGSQLQLDKEAREITTKIRESKFRDSLEFVTRWAVRPDDLQQNLLEVKPQVLHFSGHGSADEEIVLVDNDGNPKPVSKEALQHLLEVLKDNLQVVVLNACYSRPQAKAITQCIDCAIGMTEAIGDEAAILFAGSFYRALGFGRSVQEAFELGISSLEFEKTSQDKTPELVHRKGVDTAKLRLILDQHSPTNIPLLPETVGDKRPTTADNGGLQSTGTVADWKLDVEPPDEPGEHQNGNQHSQGMMGWCVGGVITVLVVLAALFVRLPGPPKPGADYSDNRDSFLGALPNLKWIIYDPTQYDPFSEQFPSRDSIKTDLRVLHNAGFDGLITVSCRQNLSHIPRIAHEVGFNQVIAGVFDLRDDDEIDNALAAAKHVDAYCLGHNGFPAMYTFGEVEEQMADSGI